MSELWPAAIAKGGCDPARCRVWFVPVDSFPAGWHVNQFFHDAGRGPREVVVAVYLPGQRLGVPGGLDRPAMDRLVDAWNAAFAEKFPVHHEEAWADG